MIFIRLYVNFTIDTLKYKLKKRIRPSKSEVKRLYSCNKKAIKLLKWKPKFSGKKNFYKGIYKTCEWFEKNKKILAISL